MPKDPYATYVYEIEGVPLEFSHMTEPEFRTFITTIPLGYRLTCMASWPERMFVAAMLKLIDDQRQALFDEELLEFFQLELTPRRRWILLGLTRWFGAKLGLQLIRDVMGFCDGRFFSVWDGQRLWAPNRNLPWCKCDTVEALVDTIYPGNPPTLLPPAPEADDHAFVTEFMRWLSSEPGNRFVCTVLEQIQAERDRLRAEEERALALERIDRDTEAFRNRRIKELDAVPA